MKTQTLPSLPDWPALMDVDTTILYLGNNPALLERLEASGALRRWQNGNKGARFLRAEIDAALREAAAEEKNGGGNHE